MRIGGLSMRGATHNDAAASASASLRAEPFTPEAVTAAWTAFAEAHGAEPALAAAMRKFVPELKDGKWDVGVDSIVTANLLQSQLDHLMPHMRDALRNDSFDLHFTILNQGVIPPEYWSDTQVLQHMLEDPDFAAFYKKMHLTVL